MEVIMEADHRARRLVRTVALDHLPSEGKPGAPVSLDESAPLIAVNVRLDDVDPCDRF
jgi:hypothetical protein